MALFDDGQVGSSGTLMGAAMETCGHYLQSQLLEVFHSNLAVSLGMLLFLIGGIAAIFIIAVGGKYKFAYYFLLGPALFWQTTLVVVPSQGAKWQFADEERPYQKVHDAAGSIASEWDSASDTYEIKDMKVSWFFALWNDFSSGVIQSFTRLLHPPQNAANVNFRAKINFSTKVDRYLSFNRLTINDPDIKKYIVLTSQNRCPNYFRSMQIYWNPAVSGVEKSARTLELIEEHSKKVAFASGDDLLKFADEIGLAGTMCLAYHHPDAAHRIFPLAESPFESCPANPDKDNPPVLKESGFTCHDVWRMGIAMLRIHGQVLIEELVSHKVPQAYDSDGNLIPNEELVYAERLKLAQKFGQINYGADFGGSRSANVSDDQAMANMLNELAARLMIDQLKGLEVDVSQVGRQPRALTKLQGGRILKQDVSADMRLLDERTEWRGKGDLYTAALALPYIQGLLLYWLAAAYPFFACALLVPGRHLGFTLWMALWFWVKSWDFGYAMVMVVDEMLYFMFPHGDPIGKDLIDKPHELIQTVLEVDPIHSEQMYYNLVAACMLSIPVITGIMVKKGGSEISSAITQGFGNFAGRSGHSFSAFYGSMRAQTSRGDAQMRMVTASENAGVRSIVNNPNVRYHASMAQELNRRADAVNAGNMKMSSADTGFINQTLLGAGMQGLDKITGNTKSVVSGVLKAKATQHMNIAEAHIKRDQAYARWHESMSDENRRLAGDAILLRYYSHDFTDEPPIMTEMNLRQQRNFCMLANVADQGMASYYFQGPEIAKRVGQVMADAFGSDIDNMTNANLDSATQVQTDGRGRNAPPVANKAAGSSSIPTELPPKKR